MHQIINSSIEILEQGQAYLDSARSDDYCQILSPYLISSCGQHMRHAIDHFLALREALVSGNLNYDKRHRGGDCETDIEAAKQQIAHLIAWLQSLPEDALDLNLEVSTEISVRDTTIAVTNSSLARELLFVNSHAIHHYSVISIVAKLQQQEVDDSFGIAPATATFLRELPCAL